MPDRQAPVSIIQNSFATGEVTPSLYGRTDLQKYHSGCAVLRNFYVDFRGGVTTRPGTQFIGNFAGPGYGRLWSFQFSPDPGQTYVLAFSDHKLRFIKNPGTSAYPNSSNAGLIFSGGVPYEIATPYAEGDLPYLHFLQIADTMWITCQTCHPYKLLRHSDTNWTLVPTNNAVYLPSPTVTSVTISANPSGSSDPGTSRYMYAVSTVDADGNESPASTPFISPAGINIGATSGTVTINWTSVAGALFYKVYKALPTHGDKVPQLHEQMGFIGYSYGTLFTDSNIVADFARPPIGHDDPFANSAIIGYTITNPGTGYPAEGTAITVTDATGTGAIIYPTVDNNTAGATGGITGLYIAAGGHDYTAPTLSATGGGTGFTATVQRSPATGNYPKVVGAFQQRLIYGATQNKPSTIWGSRVGAADDFRKSNPVVDSDAFEFTIFDHQVTEVNWVHSMPGGLLIGTDNGVFQLTGGSATAANPVAVTPANAVMVPQTSYGAADVLPTVIDSNVLYVQIEGSNVRDMQYNYFTNVYSSSDITILSSHLIEGRAITDWTYQDSPSKVIWARTTDGILLSLTYLKPQEVAGWARHDMPGAAVESLTSVQEGIENIVYLSVNRNGVRTIERMASQRLFQRSDAWQLDSAVSIDSNYPNTGIHLAAATGTNVLVTADAAVFGSGDVGKRIYSLASSATIISYVSPTQVMVTVTSAFDPLFLVATTWRMDPVVGSVSGLGHLNGMYVWALVDGEPQGPFLVSSGTVTLTTPGSQVVVGLPYVCRLQPLYLDVGGEATIQGKRKKAAAASIRVRNTDGLRYGVSFGSMKEWEQWTSSTDPTLELPYGARGLHTGDQRIAVNQVFTVGGWICIEQAQPLPATVLAVITEMAQGDVM